jgi:predicted MFS family arabinose efflux permease
MYFGLGLLIVYLPQWLTGQFPLDIEIGGQPLLLFGMPVDFIAALFAVGGVVSVLTSPVAGALSDRIGRKPLILASCFGLAVVTLLVTYVVTVRWRAYPLYVAIMLLFALRMTPLQALLTALVPARQRGTLLSLTIAVGQIGTGIGASLGGVLYAELGYRANTFVSAVSILLMAALVWRFLPEPAHDAPRSAAAEVASGEAAPEVPLQSSA